MKYKNFLPFISNSTFDFAKLKTLLYKLWIDASMYMEKEYIVSYEEYWKIGFKISGSTVDDYVWLEHKDRIPTANELEEVTKAMKEVAMCEYRYDKKRFYINEEHPNRRCAVMYGKQ
jgi:hypothetical protein